jgi:3-(3-hydroxy-phenyl)propionate hydroxylase
VSESEVIIVGAGPTGLALSLVLARFGVSSLVLDSGDGEVTVRAARTCVLRPDTAAWLPTASGSGDSATGGGGGSAAGVPAARWARWRTRRRQQLVQDVELTQETSPLHLEQHALEQGLRAALEREKLARIIPRSHLDILEQDATGVTAHTRPYGSGSGVAGRGGGTWWRGSYLVGCDGARSTVRKLLGVPFAGRTAVERHAVAALRTHLPWESEAVLDRDLGGVHKEVTARPLPGGVWRLDWLLPPRGELVTPDALLDHVHSTLALWHGTGRRRDSGTSGASNDRYGDPGPYELLDTGVHTSHQRLARRWRVDRAFLAGDAAHLVGALGVQSVDEGLRDAANLAWKLAVASHEMGGVRGPRVDRDALEALLDSYETERRGAVAARLRAVDQALPLVRRDGGALRAILPGGGVRTPLELLTDGHLGRGLLGAPAAYRRSPLAPTRSTLDTVLVDTAPGAPVDDVPVIALNGERGRLRERLSGVGGGELLVMLVAPGTGVWDSRHWRSAGVMPELAAAVEALPLKSELLVTDHYPGASAHTVLVIRPDGHLVAALPGPRTGQLRACADAVRGGGTLLPGKRPATSREARR